MAFAARSSWRTATIVLLGGILLAAAHPLWLPLPGRCLVAAEPPFPADLVVVLAGDWRGNRILRAAELVRDQYAPQALVSGPAHHYGLREHEIAIPFAERHGYPASYFIAFPVESNSTREEVAEIAVELRRRQIRRAIVVTSDYHTARAGRLFRAAAGDIEIRVVAAPDDFFQADAWWKNRESQKIFLFEWIKTVATVFGL